MNTVPQPKKTRFIISIVGYDHQSTKIAAQEISNFFSANNHNISAMLKLPKKKQAILSIRRSHFIYKESRDQFLKETHKIVIFVNFDEEKLKDLPEKFKKVQLPMGVNVHMKVQNLN